jgi:hypothetical protein
MSTIINHNNIIQGKHYNDRKSYSKRVIFIDGKAFIYFSNKINNCLETLKKKEKLDRDNFEVDDDGQISCRTESIDDFRCCICFINRNEIILKCKVR